jgi:hypothetical protein
MCTVTKPDDGGTKANEDPSPTSKNEPRRVVGAWQNSFQNTSL